jgi:hypothetical protein
MGRNTHHPPKSASTGVVRNGKIHIKEAKEKAAAAAARPEREDKPARKVAVRKISNGAVSRLAKREWRRLEVARVAADATYQSQSLMKKAPNALFKLMHARGEFKPIAVENAMLRIAEKSKHLSPEEAAKLALHWEDETRHIRAISKHAVTTLGEIWDTSALQSLHAAAEILSCEQKPAHRQKLSAGKALLAVRIKSLCPRPVQSHTTAYPHNIFAAQNEQLEVMMECERIREANRALRAAKQQEAAAAVSAASPDMSSLPAKPVKSSKKKAILSKAVSSGAKKIAKKTNK